MNTTNKPYIVYFNDNVNEIAALGNFATEEEARSFAEKQLEGVMYVDEEHNCTDDVFYSSKVAYVEIYNGEPVTFDEEGEEVYNEAIFISAPFYSDTF